MLQVEEDAMGVIFKAPAFVIWGVCGIWSLMISFDIVEKVLGFGIAVLSMLFIPAVVAIAPWYAGFVWGDWFPVFLAYGGGILATVLFSIGSVIDKNSNQH